MTGLSKGLLLGAIQIALVLSLGGKLLYDRRTRPRVWVLSEVYDPELPIRGRYLSERLRLPAEGFVYRPETAGYSEWYMNQQWAYLQVRDGQLIANRQGTGSGEWIHLHKNINGSIVGVSEDPVLLFIPEKLRFQVLKPARRCGSK